MYITNIFVTIGIQSCRLHHVQYYCSASTFTVCILLTMMLPSVFSHVITLHCGSVPTDCGIFDFFSSFYSSIFLCYPHNNSFLFDWFNLRIRVYLIPLSHFHLCYASPSILNISTVVCKLCTTFFSPCVMRFKTCCWFGSM